MKTLNEFLSTLAGTPLPNLLILAGLFFLLLSIVTKVGGVLVVSSAKQRYAALFGILLFAGGFALHWREQASVQTNRHDEARAVTRDYLVGHIWTFSHDAGDVISAHVRLDPSGTIEGIDHPNETGWVLDDAGVLVFLHASGEPSTRFDQVNWRGERAVLRGRLLLSPPEETVTHVLEAH
jgi:hypothetical protein